MIKVVRATHKRDYTIEVEFSDGSIGDCDLAPTFARESSLTRPLRDPEQFRRFFIEFGALCWPNGFELSPTSIQQRLRETGMLRHSSQVA
jgi:hypothetical protein